MNQSWKQHETSQNDIDILYPYIEHSVVSCDYKNKDIIYQYYLGDFMLFLRSVH